MLSTGVTVGLAEGIIDDYCYHYWSAADWRFWPLPLSLYTPIQKHAPWSNALSFVAKSKRSAFSSGVEALASWPPQRAQWISASSKVAGSVTRKRSGNNPPGLDFPMGQRPSSPKLQKNKILTRQVSSMIHSAGQTHCPASGDHYFKLKIFLFLQDFKKVGTDRRMTWMKKVITTDRDRGSAL